MVEIAVRPRMGFSTFMRSDTNVEGEGLSFYDYKRLLRTHRVARLQQNRPVVRALPATAGYKLVDRTKPFDNFNVSRQDAGTQTEIEETENEPVKKHITRQVKSATFRPAGTTTRQVVRPQTAGGRQLWKCDQTKMSETIIEDLEPNTAATTSDGHVASHEDLESNINKLLSSYNWSTTTRRAYNEVGWENKLPKPLSDPPQSTLRNLPDPVSLRFTNKRNELRPQEWQSLGNAWDNIQTRDGSYKTKNSFCSPYKRTFQIPGYIGYMVGEPDRNDGEYKIPSIVTTQPRYTQISRRSSIPGYSGCSYWSSSQPNNSRNKFPTSYVTEYRQQPLDGNLSPYVRQSVMSKMVSLLSPYNPFNKIEPKD